MERIKHILKRTKSASVFFGATISTALILTVACERWIDPEYNTDPAAAADVPMSLIIPTIELDVGFILTGINVVEVTNIWMQYCTGVNYNLMNRISNYQLDAGDFDLLWWRIYTTQLINAKILIEKAEQLQSPYNAAVGQILTAYTLGVATDLWGDIPYSHALKGQDLVLQVPYDTQEQIYSSIDSLLDLAILNLSVDPGENMKDIEGDVYYNGDPGAWKKAARAIRARHLLQLSKRNGTAAYEAALEFVGSSFEGNEDNMKCPFDHAVQNPHYQDVQYTQSRKIPPSVVMCTTFLDELEETNDPRIPSYFGKDTAGGISAAAPGARISYASVPGEYLAGETGPLYLMTYSELKFIEAEAALMTGDAESADSAYQEAVKASIMQVTAGSDVKMDSIELWLEDNIYTATAGSISLEKIIRQKRIALFGQLQPYSDWRRTGIPALVPVPDARLPEIPQRYLYTKDEQFYNEENVPYATMTDPVWWAADNVNLQDE